MNRYPVTFPMDAAQELIAAYRDSATPNRTAKLVSSLWWLGGFGLYSGFGGPDDHLTMAQAAETEMPADFAPVVELQKAVDAETAGPTAQAIAIPWALLAQWALSELARLISKR